MCVYVMYIIISENYNHLWSYIPELQYNNQKSTLISFIIIYFDFATFAPNMVTDF